MLLVALTLPYSSAIDFGKEVAPIVKERCVSCHVPRIKRGKRRKPAGGVRLDSAVNMMKGNRAGKAVIVPGLPEESSFYTLTTLPEGHDDVMPAEGGPLSETQQQIIRSWILQGAQFGAWKGFEGLEIAE